MRNSFPRVAVGVGLSMFVGACSDGGEGAEVEYVTCLLLRERP